MHVPDSLCLISASTGTLMNAYQDEQALKSVPACCITGTAQQVHAALINQAQYR